MLSTQRSRLPRLAVIGCGAAAKEFFLPALQKHPGFRDVVTVVDSAKEQAERVAETFGIKQLGTDYRDLSDDVDAAIIATPHRFHAEQALHFLERGKHVLVEKPIGMNAAEVGSMLDAATANNVMLTVNNYRRLFPAYRRVHEMLSSRELGEIRKITIRDGTKFAWQSVSSFYVRDPQARGVLLDRGAHTVDVLCWWLGERPHVESAELDAIGRVEGLVNVRMSCRGIPISLKFSRFQRLENRYTIECERGTIRGRLFDFARFQLLRDGRIETVDAGEAHPHSVYAWQLINNFVDAIQGSSELLVRAEDVALSISVIDEAYNRARPMDLPWYSSDPNICWLTNERTRTSGAETSQPI